ncbi:MAG: hypothetical protein C6Y22_26660 [Hapalosiphonaceae cyanobacterium JJU2]|nr:MAG: hypothetical protein C6Y22_26660 [Hapalosiphonaceae cyanobacterium JJU2]
MKEKSLRFRMSERRYHKLKLYADKKEKTMTQLIEDWIDRLPNTESGKNNAAPISQQPTVDID